MKRCLTVLFCLLTLYIASQVSRQFNVGIFTGVNYGKVRVKDHKINKCESGYIVNVNLRYHVNSCTGIAVETGYEKKNSRFSGSDDRIQLNYYNFRLLFNGYVIYAGRGLMHVTFGGFYNQLERGNSIISRNDYGLSFSLEPGRVINQKVLLGAQFRYEKGLKNIYAPEPKIRDLRSSYFSFSGGITWFL